MHYFPCTPDCPLEIYADWLEDQGIDPGEIRLLAAGWCDLGNDLHSVYSFINTHGFGNYCYGYTDESGDSSWYCIGYGNGGGFVCYID